MAGSDQIPIVRFRPHTHPPPQTMLMFNLQDDTYSTYESRQYGDEHESCTSFVSPFSSAIMRLSR
jgi:hypothetical protein